jgi:hypothetical protein
MIDRIGGKPNAYAELLNRMERRRRRFRFRNPHPEQRDDDGDVADAVDQEAPSFAGGRDQDASYGWSDQPCDIHHRRVERDRVPQVLPVLDHGEQERLAAGHVERIDNALDDAEGDDPVNRDGAGERQHGKRERLEHRHGLRHDEQAMTIPPVDVNARHRTEEKRWKLAREADDAKQQR